MRTADRLQGRKRVARWYGMRQAMGERVDGLLADRSVRPVLFVFGAGVIVRLLVMLLYSSTTLTYYGGDSTRYLRLPVSGYTGLFSDPDIPAGYPMFLHLARWVSRDIVATTGLQHLLGIAAAAALYRALRLADLPRWAAIIPAGLVLFSGDELFTETSILSEALWVPLMAAGIWATVRAAQSESMTFCLVAGGAFALSALARNISLPFALLAAVYIAWDVRGSLRTRLRLGGCVIAAAISIIGAYSITARAEGGYAGFSDMSGFSLYSRAAPFADCHDFTPPAGTAKLCESVPVAHRDEGPFYYTYNPASPMYRAGLGADPKDAVVLGRFAEAAILHQPLDYLKAVAKDLVRYVAPYAVTSPPNSGVEPDGFSFFSVLPHNQGQTPGQLAADYAKLYTHVDRTLPGQTVRELIGAYQEVVRENGLVVLACVVIAVVGLFLTRERQRRLLLFLLVMALYLYLLPVAVSTYDVRYGIPPGIFLVAAAALGLPAVLSRLTPPTHGGPPVVGGA